MLNIEVIKFEAQDVITASVCKHTGATGGATVTIVDGKIVNPITCNNCGAKGTYDVSNGSLTPATSHLIKWDK